MTRNMELEEELKATRDGYEEEISVLLEQNEDLRRKLGIHVVKPEPGVDIRSGDYIILDDTNTNPTVMMKTVMIMKTKLEQILWSLPLIRISSRPPYHY